MSDNFKSTLNGISNVQNLYNCLNVRKSLDDSEYEVFALHHEVRGCGESLAKAFSNFSEKAFLFSISQEGNRLSSDWKIDSKWLHSSLGKMLRIRPDEAVDFHHLDEGADTGKLNVTTNLRWETEAEAFEDKKAFERLLEAENEGRLVIGSKASMQYRASSRELVEAYILLWPQMAQVIEEDMLLCSAQEDFELYRIDISYDPEDGQASLNFSRDFLNEESQSKYYEKLNAKVDDSWKEDNWDAIRYINGPEGLGAATVRTSSKRVKEISYSRK